MVWKCNVPDKTVALAALIQAASESAAAPGHTAQPLQPTRTAKPFLQRAWAFDIADRTKKALGEIAGRYAREIGGAQVGDANEAAAQLRKGDLVFIDTPYSGEHYSRFYHVLETIVNGECGEVSGVGRYPARDLKPKSKFSLKTESNSALDNLLETIAKQGAKAILGPSQTGEELPWVHIPKDFQPQRRLYRIGRKLDSTPSGSKNIRSFSRRSRCASTPG
jgi:adenine-specific DNA-methyltransferase